MATKIAAEGVMPKAPYVPQDVEKVTSMVRALDGAKKLSKSKGGGFSCKKTSFDVKTSQDGVVVDSWKMQEWDYKKPDLPTYARGLFTTKNRLNEPEIVVRGYDKFFNVGEVHETKWENILARTKGPYELTLKENGCIIFISGLEDGSLLVCSKHSTGERGDSEISHAIAGERMIEKQLAALGKTKEDLARELRDRNATAVAELCDDSFEEHILEYGPDKAGLYIHGINLNLPEFVTYPSALVQSFGDAWGFKQVGLIIMDDVNEVKSFLEGVAETGAYGDRDVEGFVVRCKESHAPESEPYRDWFFKYKFEEPYLMYRQWRECTKAMITGKPPRYKKHVKITEEYLLYARRRLQADKELAKLYQHNHGIIALRNDFLAFKNIKGSDAANLELAEPANVDNDVSRDVILVPIATIGCGKTTIAVALQHLFNWGHIQNDNISGKGRPPRFTKAVLDLLKEHPVVIADRNNAQKHERKQILNDVKAQHQTARLVALYFALDESNIKEVRRITQERVLARGDNHQTIHAATDAKKFLDVMEGFISRFESIAAFSPPDNGFDNVIQLDPTANSRENLEKVIVDLHKMYPSLVPEVPPAERLDEAMQSAFVEYKPEFKHNIPDRGPRKDKPAQGPRQQGGKQKKKKPLEYMSVDVPANEVRGVLDGAFNKAGLPTSRFYKQLLQTRRVQPKFHVTLMHRASSKDDPGLWSKYLSIHANAEKQAGGSQEPASALLLGECSVELERVVFDDRIMSIVVRLVDPSEQWKCTNNVAHITVGTRDDSVKPKESNDLLARWLDKGTGAETGIYEVVFDTKPVLQGTVQGVLSR
ncbi:fungal tRNA ligase adenylyltransferase [Colletotrichum graminicola M1.001]|uniref:tRNA ligase n=1 Tax=Colletotrichum graminicola (strain M1.001 / M2 / FGSC 10212) TaxID=645133 RepID=E3QYW0_COLGM|nr:fungal tRNA ligase adenylyltransferase [Colletotrichum graminicola M1.001]EFQ36048.1 fungal tRNA ligase adenylyltransferase [Colletotrichum graminicola M1.001]